jgi:cytoskeletal protein CcmA (bactofilin family)
MTKRSGLMTGEKGQILIWVIALMMLAALVIPPFVAMAYGNLHTSAVRQEKMQELYAADTGIEDAVAWIASQGNISRPGEDGGNATFPFGESTTPAHAAYRLSDWNNATLVWVPKLVNNCWVDVRVERDLLGNWTYFIYSNATNIDTRGQVKVRAHVSPIDPNYKYTETPNEPIIVTPPGVNTNPFAYGMADLGSGITLTSSQGDVTGDIFVNGPVNLLGGQNSVDGNIYSMGDLRLEEQSYVTGNASVTGNIYLEEGSYIEGKVWGNKSITLTTSNGIWGNVYAQGNINIYSGSLNSSAWAGGNVTVSGSSSVIHQSAFANNNINVTNRGMIDSWAYYLNNLNISGGGSVGNFSQMSQPLQIPQPIMPQISPVTNPDAAYWGNASTGPTLPAQTVSMNNSPVNLGPCVVQNSLLVKNNAKLILDGTVYVLGDPNNPRTTGTIDLSNGAIVTTNTGNASTPRVLVATGDISIDANIFAQPEQTMPLIMSVYGNIEVWNNGNITAALFAPNGTVYVHNNAYVDGAIVAQKITPVKDTGQQGTKKYTVIYNPAVQNIEGLPYATIQVPQEPVEEPQPPTVVQTATWGVCIDSYIILED